METRSGSERVGQTMRIAAAAASVVVAIMVGPVSVAGAADAQPPTTLQPTTQPPVTEASSFEPGGSTVTVPDEFAPAGPIIDSAPIVTDSSSFEPAGSPVPLGPTFTPSEPASQPTSLAYTGGAEAVMALVGLGLIGLGSTTCRIAAKRGTGS